ncbi:MAG: HD domain-containing protein, partial [Vicinamibacterales bacterium]
GHITDELGAYLEKIVRAGFGRVIGTSGTILSLGAMAWAAERGRAPDEVRNLRVPSKAMHRLRKTVLEQDINQRLKLPAVDPRRVDLLVAGSVLFDTILRELGAEEFTLCDYALREGLVLDYIARNRKHIAQIDRYPDVRRRSVIELCERCRYWPEHAQQVARLATSLFDQTRPVHGLTEREREWLEYAALMHDIGVHISYPRHHKHSYYLIKNGDLRGFEPTEIEFMALVARYHRSNTPKKSHEGMSDLKGDDRRMVRMLAALLRLAEGLERSHSQVVSKLELHDRRKDYLLKVRANGDSELELWAAHRQRAPLEALVGKPIYISADGTGYAEQSHISTSVSRQVVRRGRDRRVRKDDAAVTPGQVADRRRSARLRH